MQIEHYKDKLAKTTNVLLCNILNRNLTTSRIGINRIEYYFIMKHA